jgi:superfamily II DNA/RNA helicase
MPPTFADLGVPARLGDQLARRGITAPFPIQAATLPDALDGRDVCGRAPTGSGKTIAFGLAIAARVGPARPRRPRALVLVPTRELASQVAGEIQALLPPRSGRVATIYGGAGYGPQRKALERGAAVVVACPGRLEDLVAQGDVDLGDVDLVVLDEADQMADMGFLPAVRRLLDDTSPDRQTLLFSATLDGEVDAVVRRYQHDPARHDVTPPDDENAGTVDHAFWRAERSQRVALTAALVREHGRALVFCRTRRGADRVAKQLKDTGLRAVAIHGNRTQSQRERALAAFAGGKADALVATDVAARGIHVDHVACVVHFDVPDDPKDYVHRSGRTGRAGASGTVVSLVPDENRRAVRTLQRSLGFPQSLDAPPVVTGRPARPPAVADDAPEADATSPDVERPARPGRPRRRDQFDGGDRRGRPARSDWSEQRDQADGGGRPARPGKAGYRERTDGAGRPSRPARGGRSGYRDDADETARPTRSGKPGRRDQNGGGDRRGRPARSDRSDRSDRSERSERWDQAGGSERPARPGRPRRKPGKGAGAPGARGGSKHSQRRPHRNGGSPAATGGRGNGGGRAGGSRGGRPAGRARG